MRLLFTIILPLTLGTLSALADESQISMRVTDAQGELIPARGWVESGGKKLFKPQSADATPYPQDQSFSCDGTFVINVPAGKARIHIEKGKEFRPVDLNASVGKDDTLEVDVQLERWIDMPKRGWYSADLHVHLGYDNPRVLKQLALADDVHLIPSFTYWLRGRGEVWRGQWPDGTFNRPIVIDDSHLITRNNIEIERIDRSSPPGGTVGATFLFNLDRPVTAVRYGEHYPTDAALCRSAKKHSPHVVFDSDKPSWAETVIGAAFGMLDTIQVCNNHYHRLATLPGGYGMIGPLAPGESNAAVGDGLFHRTNDLYYRFLNCGFRLGVSGGSAIGVMPVPTGYNRVYAKIDGPLTADKMWDAINAGRSFATSGPMLDLSADDQPIGSTLLFASTPTKPITVRTTVESIERLECLQIVHNGAVVASRELLGQRPDPVLKADLEFKVTPKSSGWVISRALYRAPDGLLRQAHTSPIYVSVDNKPIASAEDASYMLRWIDRLEEIAKANPDRFPDADAQSAVLTNYAEAKSKYEKIRQLAVRAVNSGQ